MIPVPGPSELIEAAAPYMDQGLARRMVVGPPDGDPTGSIAAVEAMLLTNFSIVQNGEEVLTPVFLTTFAFSDEEIEAIVRDRRMVVAQIGVQMRPFYAITFEEAVAEMVASVEEDLG